MKSFLPLTLLVATAGLSTSLPAQTPTPAATPATPATAASTAPGAPKTDEEKLSYAIGVDVLRSLKQQSIDIDPQFVIAGMHDSAAGGQMQMTADQMMTVLREMQQTQRAKQQEKMAKLQETRKAAGANNATEGTKFLAENKGKPGVVTLPDGLQYKVLTEGTGPVPKDTDTVTVNYRGTLINGTEFDSSYKRNEPATFPVNGVIRGWTEILQKMKVGSKYQVFIPSDLAYGEHGAGQDIGADATLIFEIELLSIK